MPNPEPRIGAVVMASGFSRRLGCNKLLLPLDKGSVIGTILEQLRRVVYDPVAVVSRYDEVLTLAEEMGFHPVPNPSAAEGKSSSIRLGIGALQRAMVIENFTIPAGLIFFTGDQVLLSDSLLRKLRDVFLEAPDRIVVPVYDGAPGSPVTFPSDMIPRLMELKDEEGGMKAAKEQAHRIQYVPAEPGWQGMDIDTEESWRLAADLFAAHKGEKSWNRSFLVEPE